jgi:protein-S-isoprenylcysteine O-methyltransferase Ste14
MPEHARDNSGAIAPPPFIFATAFLVGWVLHAAVPLPFLPRTVARITGALLVAAAVILVAASLRALKRVGTNVEVHKPTTAIVVDGPYRYTRNPIYVSLTLLYAGIAIFARMFWPLLLLPIVLIILQRGVVDREERYLTHKFGDEYISYKGRVRRWV